VRETLIDLVRRISERDGIVVAAGHDLTELGRMCARGLLFAGGRLVGDGPFDEVARSHHEGLGVAEEVRS
jgi:ABC-type multidrug transport system ATPase subunit